MKILHLLYESRGDYFGFGGVGIRAYRLYDYLKERHDITLLCRKYPGAMNGEIDGLNHIFVGAESKSFTRTLLSYAYNAALFVKRHGEEFDIIIEEFSPAVPVFLNFYKKRPVILQIQGYTGKEYFKKYNILYSTALYAFESLRPKYYKDIIVVSNTMGDRFKLRDRHNVQVISNGISEDALSTESGESDYILFLGRLDIHHKGLDILLDAYKEFFRQFPEIKLVLAGDGRDRERLKDIIDKLPEDIKAGIQLTGWVEGDSKKAFFKDAIMFVMPSRYETQGIAALEAMAYEKPIVASNIPELDYIKAWQAGRTFNSGDAGSLARVMKKLITDSSRKEMGRNGRNRVKGYTWRKMALKYEEFLLSVCNSD